MISRVSVLKDLIFIFHKGLCFRFPIFETKMIRSISYTYVGKFDVSLNITSHMKRVNCTAAVEFSPVMGFILSVTVGSVGFCFGSDSSSG